MGRECDTSWTAMPPSTLIEDSSVLSTRYNIGRTYDIAPDGQRFAVRKVAADSADTVNRDQLHACLAKPVRPLSA